MQRVGFLDERRCPVGSASVLYKPDGDRHFTPVPEFRRAAGRSQYSQAIRNAPSQLRPVALDVDANTGQTLTPAQLTDNLRSAFSESGLRTVAFQMASDAPRPRGISANFANLNAGHPNSISQQVIFASGRIHER